MTVTFVVLNGPPKSGKTTAARYILDELLVRHYKVNTDSFAAPMKHFIASTLAEQYHLFDKDAPRAELNGYSVREFLIDLSESYIKPRYGDDFFGRMLYHRQLRYAPPPDFVVVDDSGFQTEKEALGEQARYIKIVRHGTNYNNDSRAYLPDPWCVLENNGDMQILSAQCRHIVDLLIEETKANK